MIPRDLHGKLVAMTGKFPIVSLTGPRQSGKSTLVRNSFPDYRYVSLEDPDMRALAQEDPRSFLNLYDNHVIIDEAQRVPEIFSYLQGHVDDRNESGQYILSGSQNFLLAKNIAQSLAGRAAILKLLPFSYRELSSYGKQPSISFPIPSINSWMQTGGYPRIYDFGIASVDYYPSYIQTYLDRDVREESGIAKMTDFNRFLALCATRVGKLLNMTALANECGVTVKTANDWLSILESSYIVFRLRPYHKNYGKRLIKAPKLYFHDTGLACSLLGIDDADELTTSDRRGALYENAVISELIKHFYAQGREPKLYFWRDSNKREIDILVEKGTSIDYAMEVKSSATYSPRYFKTLSDIGVLAGVPKQRRVVVYAGDQIFETQQGLVTNLSGLATLV